MARGLESILTDRRVLDWGDKIVKLEPQSYPLTVLLRAMGKEVAKNQVFVSFEDRPWVRWGVVDDYAANHFTLRAVAGAGAAPYLATYIRTGDLLWDYTQGFMLFVDSIAYDTGVITVIQNYSGRGVANMGLAGQSGKTFDTSDTTSDTNLTVADNDVILKLSNVWEDGGSAASPRAQNLTKSFNFVQKFKSSYTVDEETMLAELNGEPELKLLQARQAVEHAKDIEYQLILGKKDARVYAGAARPAQAGKYIYTSGGLYHSGLPEDGNIGAFTEVVFRSFLRPGFRYGSKHKAFVCGGLVAEGIDFWAMGRLKLNEKSTTMGLTMVDYLFAGSVASIQRHPLLEDQLEGVGFLLDMDLLKYKYMTDTKLETGLQANDAEERLDQYKTRAGLKLGLLECHRMISGVTSISG